MKQKSNNLSFIIQFKQNQLIYLIQFLKNCYIFFEQQSQQQTSNTEYQPQSSPDDYIGSFCSSNDDCKVSTFCCSETKCVPGSVCYNGQKQAQDMCDYNFECLSRCCVDKVCSHFKQCVQKCDRNTDCSTKCCSFGYCSSTSLCEGRKTEKCQNQSCKNNRCIPEEPVFNSQAIIGVIIIVAAILCVIMVYYCFCKEKDTNNQTSQGRRLGGSGQGQRFMGRDMDNVDSSNLLNQSRDRGNVGDNQSQGSGGNRNRRNVAINNEDRDTGSNAKKQRMD